MTRFLFLLVLAFASAFLAPGVQAAPSWQGERFSVEVQGNGPDVILVPGLASSRDVWKEAAQQLAATRRVHLVQVAGFAGEAPRANAQGAIVAPLVDELARYIAEAKLREPAVIGHSMGGETALALAARFPDRVGRVMVVDALPFFSLLFGPTMTPDLVRPQAEQLRDGTLAMPAEQFAAVQQRTMRGMVKSETMRPVALKWSMDSDRGTIARSAFDLMVTDLRPELGKVKVPVTVLYAADDTGPIPPARVDQLYTFAYKELPAARLVRIDGASHFLMWDQPAKFAQELDAFLR